MLLRASSWTRKFIIATYAYAYIDKIIATPKSEDKQVLAGPCLR